MIEVFFNSTAKEVMSYTGKFEDSLMFCLGEHFHLGDLTLPMTERSALVLTTKTGYCYDPFEKEDFDDIYAECLDLFEEEYENFKKAILSGDSIRIWINPNAAEECGLRWFCKEFAACKNTVIVAQRAPYTLNPFTKTVNKVYGWGDGHPNDWLPFVQQKTLSDGERQFYARDWERLVKENAPLRVLLDGEIISTDADFFDDVILSYIPTAPKRQHEIMGNILGKWNLDLAFVAERIHHLISEGKVTVCEHHEDVDGYQFPNMIARGEENGEK